MYCKFSNRGHLEIACNCLTREI